MIKAHKLGVIDYGTGNLCSVVKAFEHLGAIVSLVLEPKDLKMWMQLFSLAGKF